MTPLYIKYPRTALAESSVFFFKFVKNSLNVNVGRGELVSPGVGNFDTWDFPILGPPSYDNYGGEGGSGRGGANEDVTIEGDEYIGRGR